MQIRTLYPSVSRVETNPIACCSLIFTNFWQNCYVTSVAGDNRNHFVRKCSTTQSLNSLSNLRPNVSTGAVYQHSAQQTDHTGVAGISTPQGFAPRGARSLVIWPSPARDFALLRLRSSCYWGQKEQRKSER